MNLGSFDYLFGFGRSVNQGPRVLAHGNLSPQKNSVCRRWVEKAWAPACNSHFGMFYQLVLHSMTMPGQGVGRHGCQPTCPGANSLPNTPHLPFPRKPDDSQPYDAARLHLLRFCFHLLQRHRILCPLGGLLREVCDPDRNQRDTELTGT